MVTMEPCSKCLGRGYTLTYPTVRGVKAIRTHNCSKCGGRGEVEVKPKKVKR